MKSIQVSIHGTDPENYSDLCVMQSAAGWYVGTTYKSPEANFFEPGSRDTDYFATEKDARFVLELLERLAASSEFVRDIKNKQPHGFCDQFEYILDLLNLNPRDVGYRINP